MQVKQTKQPITVDRIEDPLEEMSKIVALLRSEKFLVVDEKGPNAHYQNYIPLHLEEGVRSNITTQALPELQRIQTQMQTAKLRIVPGKKKNGTPEEEAQRIEALLSAKLLSCLREQLNPSRVRPRAQTKKKSARAKQHDVYFDFGGGVSALAEE